MKEQVANLHARLIAAFIDSNVLAACILLSFFLYDYVFAPNKWWFYVLTIAILLVYEPLAVAWRGQTFGHWCKNIQVVRADDHGRVGFLRAFCRYFIKYFFWPFSISWMVFSHWHHSIQDLVTNTRSIPAGAPLANIDSDQEHMPVAGVRQVLVTMVWLFGLLWLFNAGIDWMLPQCGRRVVYGYCKFVAWVDDLGDIMIWILVFWYGSAGRLLGGRIRNQ